jgi:outer membrane protein assembly factor BamB
VGSKLSAGVGSDGRFTSVVTVNGEVVTLQSGAVLWRQPIGVRVATAPLVAGERVFVLGSDRSVHAFDALDGRKLWTVQRTGDPLTLLQSGVIRAFGNTLLVGRGPRLVGLDPANGNVSWDVSLASPRGTNEIERLADLVGPASRVGDVVCARAFQAAIGCVNAARGTLSWRKNYGGTDAIAADDEFVFAADATDRITAWKAANGESAWSTNALLYRGLGSPLSAGKALVFGDADGTVHFLSRENGKPLLRLPTDGSAINAAPVASGTTVLVVTSKGGLFAFRPE